MLATHAPMNVQSKYTVCPNGCLLARKLRSSQQAEIRCVIHLDCELSEILR